MVRIKFQIPIQMDYDRSNNKHTILDFWRLSWDGAWCKRFRDDGPSAYKNYGYGEIIYRMNDGSFSLPLIKNNG